MSRYISKKRRKQVATRANLCCEYCLSFEGPAFIKCSSRKKVGLAKALLIKNCS